MRTWWLLAFFTRFAGAAPDLLFHAPDGRVPTFAPRPPVEVTFEYRAGWGEGGVVEPATPLPEVEPAFAAPPSVDWRERGKVTPADSQVGGLCWLWSGVHQLESAYAIQYNTSPVVLSKQAFIDAGAGAGFRYGTQFGGCDSGNAVYNLWKLTYLAGGALPESKYPGVQPVPDMCSDSGRKWDPQDAVAGVDQTIGAGYIAPFNATLCADSQTWRPGGGCNSYLLTREQKLLYRQKALELIQQGPFATVITDSFNLQTQYQKNPGQLITAELCHEWEQVNKGGYGTHAMQVVGYSSDGDYWVVRNQWSPGWGEDGYFRISTMALDCNIQVHYQMKVVAPGPPRATGIAAGKEYAKCCSTDGGWVAPQNATAHWYNQNPLYNCGVSAQCITRAQDATRKCNLCGRVQDSSNGISFDLSV